MVEEVAPSTDSSHFETAFDAGAPTVADGITGAHCRRVTQWFCGHPVFPLNGHTVASKLREPQLEHFSRRRAPNRSMRL
jgi:hypothetical protein